MKFYGLLSLFVLAVIGCKYEKASDEPSDPLWDRCLNSSQFPNGLKSTYYVEGDLDDAHFVIGDNVDGFKMNPVASSPMADAKELDNLQSDSFRLYGQAAVSFSNVIGITLHLPAVYFPIQGLFF